MRLDRRFTAALVAASVITIAACSSDTSPNTTPEANPVVGAGNLEFTLSRTHMSFTYNTTTRSLVPMAPGSNETVVGGVIALASIAQMGLPSYLPAVNGWLTMERRIDVPAGGWRLTARPEGFNLATGIYTARVPITVPGARNNPQILTVTMVVCNSNNCIGAGSEIDGMLNGADGTWNRSTTFNNAGGYHYDDYRLFVATGQTVTVEMWGSSCGKPYTHNDVYLYAFLSGVFVTANDDWCGLNSLIHVTNNTAAGQEYLLRATSFSSGAQGTYHIRVRDGMLSNSIRLDEPTIPVDEFAPSYLEIKRERAARNN